MPDGFQRLMEYLDAEGAEYETIHHPSDFRATTTAEHTHTPPREFAKTVFVWIDGKPAMVVMGADQHLSLRRFGQAIGAEVVHLASEADVHQLCADCEVGAAPPFGNLYGLPVYASRSLAEDEEITFNGGTHENAFRMPCRAWQQLVKPEVVALARHE